MTAVNATEASIDRALCAAAQLALPLSPLEPMNSAEENLKVADNPRYNPRFAYEDQPQDELLDALRSISALSIPPEGVGRFFLDAQAYLTRRLSLRLNLGDDDGWAIALYPDAPAAVWMLARGILADPVPPMMPIKRPFRAEHLVRLIEARIREYGVTDWTVQAKVNLSSTNTDSANRVVNVRAGTWYSLEEMKRLVAHEVDIHVLRAANGASQPYRIFAVGAVPSYLMTEEGLAVINEERLGYVDVPRTRLFAGRVLASMRARTASFADVYTEQRDHGFSHDDAYNTTKRVKRGMHDTSKPGGFTKDHAYLWGRLLVEEYVVAGGALDHLFVGKIALEHLPYVATLGLHPARFTPLPYV